MKSVEMPGVILAETGHGSNLKWYVIAACVLLLCVGAVILKKKKEENDIMDLGK